MPPRLPEKKKQDINLINKEINIILTEEHSSSPPHPGPGDYLIALRYYRTAVNGSPSSVTELAVPMMDLFSRSQFDSPVLYHDVVHRSATDLEEFKIDSLVHAIALGT